MLNSSGNSSRSHVLLPGSSHLTLIIYWKIPYLSMHIWQSILDVSGENKLDPWEHVLLLKRHPMNNPTLVGFIHFLMLLVIIVQIGILQLLSVRHFVFLPKDLPRLHRTNAGDWRFYTHCWNGDDGLSEFVLNDWKCR